eukprot:gene40134-53026_t
MALTAKFRGDRAEQFGPVSLAVVGAGAAGIELVFAAEQAIREHGMAGARFTLITGGPEVADGYRPAVQRKVLRQLKRRGITVLREACVGIGLGEVVLGNGAHLACDVPLLAIGTHAPPWLQGSGLALSESGHVLVNAFQQSTSHPQVFAAGDVASRADVPHARSGVYAVRAGPPLAHNLLAFHQRKPLKPHQPPTNTLNLLSCGTGHAIASYGPLSLEGAWAWRWKDRIDRGFIERYRVGPRPAPQASGESLGAGRAGQRLVAPPEIIQAVLLQLFQVQQGVVGAFGGADQLVDLDLQGLGVAVLRVLDQEHHEEGDDGGAGVDHQLPSVRKAEHRPADSPKGHYGDRCQKGQRAAKGCGNPLCQKVKAAFEESFHSISLRPAILGGQQGVHLVSTGPM